MSMRAVEKEFYYFNPSVTLGAVAAPRVVVPNILVPGDVDDLKAIGRDFLDNVQNYIRNSHTKAWEAYWIDPLRALAS